MNKNENIKRKDYITLLSVISAIAVVFLHANGCFWHFSNERYWFTANIIESIFYFAVPVFFMITGANLIDYQERYTTKEYFKKRIKKVLIPFIVWSFIGIIYMAQKNHILIWNVKIESIVNYLFNGTAISIYWFFPPLLCSYLCIPLFASVEKNKKKSVFSYLTLTGFILNCVVPFIIKVFNLNISNQIQVIVCNNYLIYILLGYLIDKSDLNKKHRIIIYFLGIIGLFAHIIGTYVLSINANEIIKTYKEYMNVPCILYSIGIFVFVKELCKNIRVGRVVNCISKYTFSIYLIHWYILDILCRLFHFDTTSIIYRLGMPFVVIPMCILITFIMRKIPILKKIVP